MPPSLIPQRVGGFSGRISRFLFQWESSDGLDPLGRLVARSGQIGVFSRAGVKTTALDITGAAYNAGYHVPAFNSLLTGGFYVPSGVLLEAADSLTFPFNALPTSLTVYVKLIERFTNDSRIFTIGNDAAADAVMIYRDQSGTNKYIGWHKGNAATAVAATAAISTSGHLTEHRLSINANGSITAGTSIDGGAETTGADATAATFAATFSALTITLNKSFAGILAGAGDYQTVRIAAGPQSLAFMRA